MLFLFRMKTALFPDGDRDRFKGPDPVSRQAVREWLFWDVDVLFPAVFGCYAAELDRKQLLRLLTGR